MTILEWSGEIGWELWLPELRAQLKSTKGDDITVRFSSIGGSIFEGSDIFNMLADHRRDNPSIKMNLEIKAVALSMGSAIAASPVWDEITIEPTSMVMMHNPSNITWGDFREMLAEADFLEKARDMWAGVYAAKSGATLEETQIMMDATTWLFGQEIIDAGFADKLNATESTDPVDKVVAMRHIEVKFSEMKRRQQDLSEGEAFDADRAVACLRLDSTKQNKDDAPSGVSDTSGSDDENAEEAAMKDKAELQDKHPAIYDESVKDGVMKERTRVKALTDMKGQDEYKDIPEIATAIDKAIEDGKSPDETSTIVMAVMVKIFRDPDRADETESPPNIQGSDQKPPAMSAEKIREV